MLLFLYFILALVSLAAGAPSYSVPARPLSATLRDLGINPARFSNYDQRDYLGKIDLTCAVLEHVFGPISTSASEGGNYTALALVNWSETCQTMPGCIVSPADARDVARTVMILDKLQTKFSVRSGGHMANPGFSNAAENAVLVEVGSLRQLSMSRDRSSLSVGVGNRWGSVLKYAEEFDRTVIGGRVADVGVGGLLMGGGLSYFTPGMGLACDNLLSVEIVLSDGRVRKASRNENPDLFKAIKGGSANFGIVTEYELRTHRVGMIYAEGISFPQEDYRETMEALVDFQREGLQDPKVGVLFSFTKELNGVFFIYLEPRATRPRAFSAFDGLTSTTVVPPANLTMTQLVDLVTQGFNVVNDERALTRVTSFVVDEDVYNHSYQLYRKVLRTLPPGAVMNWIPQPISDRVPRIGAQNGGNVLGLSNRPQVWLDIVARWQDPAHDAFMHNATKTLLDQTDRFSKRVGSYLPYLFMNDASWDQNVLRSYGSAGFQHIVKTSKKYDPTQMFQRLQNNGYLWTRA